MTSVTSCILGKAASGIIDKDFAKKHVKNIEQYEQGLDALDPDVPQFKRVQQLTAYANRLKELSDIKKLQLVKEIESKSRLDKFIKSHPKGTVEGFKSSLTYDLGGYSKGLNIDKQAESIRSLAFSGMGDVVTRLSLQKCGFVQDKKLAAQVVRALYGDTSDELAGKMASQFTKSANMLHARFKSAGGDMGNLKDWRLPQNHDSRLINRVSRDEWVDFIRPLLDKENMIDNVTGFAMSESKLTEVLNDAYETLRTNGLNKLEPGKQGKAMLANKYSDQSRVLKFKDGDSWLAYNERFGNGDVYATMINYIDNMSQDTAMLEVFGPNPDKMKRVITDEIRKEAGLLRDEKLRRKMNAGLEAAEILWDDITRANQPANPRAALIGSELRAGLTSAQLGSAFLTQFSDVAVNTLTAKFNGLKATDLWKSYWRLMTSNKARDFSIHLGLGAEEVARTLSGAARYAEGLLDQGKLGRASEIVMRASLLDRMTMASKKAFVLDFSKCLADFAPLEFNKLNKGLLAAFDRYGITEADWAVIRKSAFDEFKGAKYLNLATLAGENLEVANKVQNMFFTERDFAVLDSNARTRAMLVGGSKAGTAWGETRRFFAMYKTFPITMLTHHMSRLMSLETATSKAGYFAALFVPMTIAGALTVQGKNLVNGKKPQPTDTWKFWVAAAAAGGAAGILGDFLFSEESRSGNGFISALAGPGASALEDAYKLTVGAAKRKVQGDKVEYPAEVIRTLKKYTPGNNLWWIRAPLERLVFDQATLALDPQARSRFRRMERNLAKEYGTEYWWKPGETKPNF